MAIGLKNDSRIKMKMAGIKQPIETLLLAAAVDRLSLLVWSKSKDAQDGINRPKSIYAQLIGVKEEKNVQSYNSIEEFEMARKKIIGE